jgi:hypothetical protein
VSTHELAHPTHDARHEPVPDPSAAPTAVPQQPRRAVPAARRVSAAPTGDPLGGTEAAPDVVEALRRRQGAGRPLPTGLAQQFGEQLGTDLSGVRVHADAEADRISRSVQATAFTHGEDVYFTQGAYAPASPSGQHLLAHELAHVAQHRAGTDHGSAAGPVIGRANDPAEAAADATAAEVVSALRRRGQDESGGAP